MGEPGVNETEYGAKLREAVYNTRNRKMYHAQAYIGLDRDFMVKAHLLVPETHENLIYNWLLNFQPINEFYNEMYESSERCENEGDIFVFSDPEWHHPDHPLGLSFFDPEHNCAAILGMRYFGEFKKERLPLLGDVPTGMVLLLVMVVRKGTISGQKICCGFLWIVRFRKVNAYSC